MSSTPCSALPVSVLRIQVSWSSCASSGLSLLGYPGLDDLDPVYCMPASLIESMGLRKGWSALPRKTSA